MKPLKMASSFCNFDTNKNTNITFQFQIWNWNQGINPIGHQYWLHNLWMRLPHLVLFWLHRDYVWAHVSMQDFLFHIHVVPQQGIHLECHYLDRFIESSTYIQSLISIIPWTPKSGSFVLIILSLCMIWIIE